MKFFGNACSGMWHDFIIGFSGKKGPGIVLRIFADQDFNITERK